MLQTTFPEGFEKLYVPVVVAIVTGVITYLLARPKTKSEIGKLDAETVSSFIKTIKEIQETNQQLFEKIQSLRTNQQVVDDLLEKTKDELADCLNRSEDCKGCQQMLEKMVVSLTEIENDLKVLDGTESLSEKVRKLSEKMVKQIAKMSEV
jgi:hypothetical protein